MLSIFSVRDSPVLNEIRSRPPKPFYKKWWFWLIVILSVTFGMIGLYIFSNEDEIANESKDLGIREESDNEETKDSEIGKSEKENIEKQTHTYEDFKGIYVSFEGEPYNSPIVGISELIVLDDDYYRSFNRWDYDMTSTILDKTIEGNVLTIDVNSDESEQYGLHSESGAEQFELRHDGDKKIFIQLVKKLLFILCLIKIYKIIIVNQK